ncbi:MAG: hypothetical protein EP338_10080 [Bacteroidetes bacterium]|nr:MAG: hypothetical protein EP338_10080 [Bacteroidota bacterium]
MMWKILSIIILIFFINVSFGQEWNEKFGSPIIVLTETNPWLMVIGSDVPTIAIYESGNIIYKRIEKNRMKYFSVKLDSTQIQNLIYNIGITDGLVNMKNDIVASSSTDQPTNELILNFDEVIIKRVYGSLRSNNEARKKTPNDFLVIYDNLTNYKNEQETEWLPDNIEILLTDFNHSQEKPKKWPKEWPTLESKTTIQRNESLYSIYLPKEEVEDFIKLISDLKETQAVELNGKKFSISYRLPFPNLR